MTPNREREYFQDAGKAEGVLFDLVSQQTAKLDTIASAVQTTASELRAHTEGEAARIAAIAAGFPDSDPIGHRRYHEAEIRRAEEKAQFWGKLRLELTKWGLLGFLGWAAVSLWQEFLKGPK